MTRHIAYPAIAILALSTLSGCIGTPEPEEPRGVLEGWIDSDGHPVVLFTASFVDNDNQAIIDKVIKFGTVRISDGTNTVLMTGGPDKDYYPPYRYTTYDITGEPGRTYTVTADWQGYHVRAQSRMPVPPDIVDVKQTPAADCDTLREVTVSIRAPQDVPAYYHISAQVIGEDTSLTPSLLGCAKADKPGEIVDIQVYRGKNRLTDKHFVPRIPSNLDVKVRVERVEPEIYRFWMNFNDATLFGGSVFVTVNKPLGGNVEDGYGYFSAQGVRNILLPALKRVP